MRTTMNIDDEALTVIRRYAQARDISLGQATSDLIQRGAENLPRFEMKNGWVIFDGTSDVPDLTNTLLDEAEMADHEEEYQRAISPRR